MVNAVKGDVVVLPFPFSDLSGMKRRPALVLAELPGNDRILCMISSKGATDPHSVPLGPDDFASGSLNAATSIRPARLFTAETSVLLYVVGRLKPEKMAEVREILINLFS